MPFCEIQKVRHSIKFEICERCYKTFFALIYDMFSRNKLVWSIQATMSIQVLLALKVSLEKTDRD
jgi:hypothetical protein